MCKYEFFIYMKLNFSCANILVCINS
uniref:Uncharacterized protein n=1 Tax=Anguilla anguilla TaxID=7936 RepID=A0A0E9WAT1_ANGAN